MRGDDVLMMTPPPRIEVFTGTARRRQWSSEQKARIVEESFATSVGDASARYGVSKSQLFNWRRAAREIKPGQDVEFAAVELDDAAGTSGVPAIGVIEIALGGGLVRVSPGADRMMVTAIITALRTSVR